MLDYTSYTILLPNILLPNKNGSYKVIQLYIDEKPILFTGNATSRHRDLLETILTDRRVPFKMIIGPWGKEMPSPNGDGGIYTLVGGGDLFKVDHRICCLGNSLDYAEYNIEINKDHLKECKKLIGAEVELVYVNPAQRKIEPIL